MITSFLRTIIKFPKRMAARWNHRQIQRSHAASPVVAFGGVLDHKKIIHGGAVKLLALRDGLKSDEKNFNILYLVSSAQPPFAQDLVRLARRRGIPFVWNQNGVGYPAWAGKNSEAHNAPMRRLREQADYVIYQSEFCREAAEKFLGPCSVPSEVLFNPVNLQKFFPLRERPSLRPLRLLTLGTHGYAERVFSTLDCLKILRDAGEEATLTIAGKFQWPQGEASVRDKIKQLGLMSAVTLLPPFSQEKAIQLYQSHHIVLHPKYLDPCPTVVIEALACGCPVVGSASGGLPELLLNFTETTKSCVSSVLVASSTSSKLSSSVSSTSCFSSASPSLKPTLGEDCGVLIPAPMSWDQMITPTGAQLAEGVIALLPRWEVAAVTARARAMMLFDEKRWVQRHQEIFKTFLSKND